MATHEAHGILPLDELRSERLTPAARLAFSKQVKKLYDELATSGASTLGCSPREVYPLEDLAEIPEWLLEVSSGCGNLLGPVDLQPGQTVADFGCGVGLDLIIAARRVGPEGKVIGIDSSAEMIQLARRAVIEADLSNVEARVGDIHRVPIRDELVDVVVGNCVLALFPDPSVVLREARRVLKPHGLAVFRELVASDGGSGAASLEDRVRGRLALDESACRESVSSVGFSEVDLRNVQKARLRDGLEAKSVNIVAFKGAAAEACCC